MGDLAKDRQDLINQEQKARADAAALKTMADRYAKLSTDSDATLTKERLKLVGHFADMLNQKKRVISELMQLDPAKYDRVMSDLAKPMRRAAAAKPAPARAAATARRVTKKQRDTESQSSSSSSSSAVSTGDDASDGELATKPTPKRAAAAAAVVAAAAAVSKRPSATSKKAKRTAQAAGNEAPSSQSDAASTLTAAHAPVEPPAPLPLVLALVVGRVVTDPPHVAVLSRHCRCRVPGPASRKT